MHVNHAGAEHSITIIVTNACDIRVRVRASGTAVRVRASLNCDFLTTTSGSNRPTIGDANPSAAAENHRHYAECCRVFFAEERALPPLERGVFNEMARDERLWSRDRSEQAI